MVLPASDMVPLDSESLSMEKPNMLVKQESLQQERQISVDPISLIESTYPPPSPRMDFPSPVFAPRKVNGISRVPVPPPLPLPLPSKTNKFLSISLPSSATSSPRFSSSMSMLRKKKWKNQNVPPSPLVMDPLTRQHSVALTRLAQLQESHLRRSKSCGERRATAPSDEFDLCLSKVNDIAEQQHRKSPVKSSHHPKSTAADADHDDHHNVIGNYKGIESTKYEEKFKCGALCLFLPGFGRGKPVREPRKEAVGEKETGHVISRTVSLEKFECGSWTSSAIIMDNDHFLGDADCSTNNLFFDLPLELIRTSVNDAESPVAAAFVFDKDVKGVLKASTSTSRSSAGKFHNSSTRHVRFSTSNSSPRSQPTSPTSCITPRLRKAREEFNAFLEAQTA